MSQKLHPYLNPATGLIEMIDPTTGSVVRVQRDKFAQLEKEELNEVVLPDGQKVWIQKGLDVSRIPIRNPWVYNEFIGALIAQQLADGDPLTKICQKADMPPYSIVCMWRRQFQEFRQMLEDARQDRAERMHDEALSIADGVAANRDEVAKAKLQTEIRQWSAEKSNPKVYGQQKTQADGSTSVTIMINTGISREGDAGYREVTPNGEGQEQVTHENTERASDNSRQLSQPAGDDGSGLGRGAVLPDKSGTGWSPGQF